MKAFRSKYPGLSILAAILILIIPAAVLLVRHLRLEGPRQAVRAQFENLRGQTRDPLSALYFRDFSYHIEDIRISGNSAEARVSLTHPDGRALARDLALETARINASDLAGEGEAAAPGRADYAAILESLLSSQTRPPVTSEAVIPLTRTDGRWSVAEGGTPIALLSGNLSDYLADPSLTAPDEILSVFLSVLETFTPQQWISFLDISDIFLTRSETLAPEVDLRYASMIAENFSFGIDDCQIDGNTAVVRVSVTSVDLSAALSRFQEKLLSYAATADSITADEETAADASARLLLEALKETDETALFHPSVTLTFSETAWIPEFSEEITDACLGGIGSAMQVFSED